ncbi:3D domain-containing protein [Metabacillus litoralis]|uniref:3D domain-containing protein n=1 Tax=Metabacillus litoralis TaxID=152268 RepID=UPI000EF617F6|nr:3D domain-containing protein [Metabacillus litoralis]
MKNKILSLITFVSLTAGFSAHAAAEEVTVKEGDTLWEIAKLNEVEVENIIDWNKLPGDMIQPEDQLKLHESHEVSTGETLWDIAEEYDVEVEEIEAWNEIDSHIIKPGGELIIKETEKAQTSSEDKETESNKEYSKELTVTATAYTANCEGCSGTTKMGIDLHANPDKKVIAVDPDVIPLGSTVEVEGYGTAIAADTGGAIKGNKIDVFIPSESDALQWGKQQVEVKIIEE